MIYKHKDGIQFRKADHHDLGSLLELKQESWWGTHKSPILNYDDQRKWFENIPSDALYLVASEIPKPQPKTYLAKTDQKTVQKAGNSLVGIATFTEIDYVARTMYVGGSVLKEHRGGDGLSRQVYVAIIDFAFEILNAHRLNAEVLETQFAALSIDMDTMGFQYEGRKRKAVYKCGRYWDSIMLGLLREEWELQDRVKAYKGCCNTNFDLDRAISNLILSTERCPPLS